MYVCGERERNIQKDALRDDICIIIIVYNNNNNNIMTTLLPPPHTQVGKNNTGLFWQLFLKMLL